MARKIILKENGIANTINTPSGYKFLGYNGTELSDKAGSTVSAVGGGTLEETLLLSNLSGTSSIFMEDTDVININGAGGARPGLILSEGNSWVYVSSDGYWSTGNNAGVYADTTGYFSLFGADWTTSFEGSSTFAGFYADSSDYAVYIGTDGKGITDGFRVFNGSGMCLGIHNPLAGTGDKYSDSDMEGVVYISTVGGYAYENSGTTTERKLRGSSFISSKNSYFGSAGHIGTVPQFSSIITSNQSIIKGRSTIFSQDEMWFSSSISSLSSTIESCKYTTIISSSASSISQNNHVAIIGHSAITMTASAVLDYSTVMENIYVDGKAHFREAGSTEGPMNIPILSSDPSSPVDGDLWAKDTGGTTTLNLRVSGVTKSITLT